jgi:sodium/potassium-transporting ATPase subunit alpha
MRDRLLTVKGAPDVLIDQCAKYITVEGDLETLNDSKRAKMEEIKNTWSLQGKRVILLARKVISREGFSCKETASQFEDEVRHHIRSELVLVGMVGIEDPPRAEIPNVISTLRGAGIRVFMVGIMSSKIPRHTLC